MKVIKSSFGFLALISLAALFQGCSSNSATALSCYATATLTSGAATIGSEIELSNISVTLTGTNTGDTYTISNLPSIGTATTTSTVYTDPGPVTVAATTTGGYSQTITVTDSSNTSSTTSCLLTAGTTNGVTSGSTGPITITASPSQVTTDNEPITLYASYAGYSSFTFAVSSANVSNYSFTPTTGTSEATISASEATITVTVTAVGTGITSTITLEWGAGGTGTSGIYGTEALTCTFSNTFGSYGVTSTNGLFYGTYLLTSNTGEALEITSVYVNGTLTSGETVFTSSPAEFEIPLQAGTFQIEITAQSATRSGYACNGGGAMENIVDVVSGGYYY